MDLLALHEVRLAIALAAGMLIGAERERLQTARADSFAGLRTFGLAGLLGGLLSRAGQLRCSRWVISQVRRRGARSARARWPGARLSLRCYPA